MAERLAASRVEFETAVVENCPVPLFAADAAGGWTRVNAPYQTLLGAKEYQLLGRKWVKFIRPDDLSRVMDEYERAVADKVTSTRIHFQHAVGGAFVNMWWHITAIPGDGYLGFAVPSCASPMGCPLHDSLLHNVIAK